MSPVIEHAAKEFLATLDPNATRFTFQTFDDNEERKTQRERAKRDPFARIIHGSWQSRCPELQALNDRKAGVYVTVNETNVTGRRKSDVTRIRAVFCEYDGKDGAVSVKHDAIVGYFPIKPTIVVESSPGKYHFYWCVSDNWLIFPDRLDKRGNDIDFSNVMERLVETYGSDKACKDHSRVLRVPGYNHNKREAHPVKLIDCTGPRLLEISPTPVECAGLWGLAYIQVYYCKLCF